MSFEELSHELTKEGFQKLNQNSFLKHNLILYLDKQDNLRASFKAGGGDKVVAPLQEVSSIEGCETLLKVCLVDERGLKRYTGLRF